MKTDAVATWIENHADGRILGWEAQQQVAKAFDLTPAEAEARVLAAGVLPERYGRNPWSQKDQIRIFASSVAVIGCGALGCALVEQCARIGIGTIHVVDPDRFSPVNLNRQLFATEKDLGSAKVDVAVRRVREVNPAVTVMAHPFSFEKETADAVLEGVDLVVDALDSVADRLLLETSCAARNLFLVHGAISGWAGQAAVSLPGEGLLAHIYGGGKVAGGAVATAGNPAFTVFTTAGIQAALACRLLISGRTDLDGRQLFFDLFATEFDLLDWQQ